MESSNEIDRSDNGYEHDSTYQTYSKIDTNEKSIFGDPLYDVSETNDDLNNTSINNMHGTAKHMINNDGSDQVHHSSPCKLIADSGDILDCPDNSHEDIKNDIKTTVKHNYSTENIHSSPIIYPSDLTNIDDNDGLIEPQATPENSMTISEQQQQLNFLPEKIDDDEDNLILPEKVDWKDLNPYESEQSFTSSQLLLPNKSRNEIHSNEIVLENIDKSKSQTTIIEDMKLTDSSNIYHVSSFDIEYYTNSSRFICPQFVHKEIETSNYFQQLWSPQVSSTKSISSDTHESTLSILWSFIILFSKLIVTGFYLICSCTKALRNEALLFGFCYWSGIFLGLNVYFLIDFLFVLTCIISIFVATYEKWLFHYVDFNEYDTTDNETQSWGRIKLVVYGLAIGTITTYII